MVDFSIFIPVLNEAELLWPNSQRLLKYLEGLGRDYEVIIGSNGSDDATKEQGQKLAQQFERVRFFALPQRGPGRAFRRAVEMARSPYLIALDMDLPTDLDFISRALELLPSHAVVIGSKRRARQERRAARILGSGAYVAWTRLLLGLPFRDYSQGAKGFQHRFLSAFGHLIDDHTAYMTNLIFAAHRSGRMVAEVPVDCRDQRPSRFNLLHEAVYRAVWVLRLFMRYRLLGRDLSS